MKAMIDFNSHLDSLIFPVSQMLASHQIAICVLQRNDNVVRLDSVLPTQHYC